MDNNAEPWCFCVASPKKLMNTKSCPDIWNAWTLDVTSLTETETSSSCNFVTDCTKSCQIDYFGWSQWLKCGRNNNISITVLQCWYGPHLGGICTMHSEVARHIFGVVQYHIQGRQSAFHHRLSKHIGSNCDRLSAPPSAPESCTLLD